MSTQNTQTFDSADPHGYHTGDTHGHTIIPMSTLRAILGALLLFTFLTVFAARAEIWFAEAFNVAIPDWVNASIAMGIAVVKALLVALFFMQLKYDNPLNAIIFSSCLFCVALFLFISAYDLKTRGNTYRWTGQESSAGGTLVGIKGKPAGQNIVQWAHESYKEKIIAEQGQAAWDQLAAEHMHSNSDHGPTHNSPAASRPGQGLTPGLFESGPWAHLPTSHAGEEPSSDHDAPAAGH